MPKIGISLGNVCKSAVWATNNGFRETKKNGYNTCPFDLMISNYKGIVECINDDFKYFCDPNYLKTNMVKNTYYNFLFNHECGSHKDLWLTEKWLEGKDHFVNNNFKNFKERYNNRISSFKNYLNDKNNYIIFIIQFKNEKQPDENLSDLRNALKNKYPHLKYEFKIIGNNI